MRIAVRCTVSLVLFVLVAQLILKAAEGTENLHLEDECYMPPLKASMDSTTVLITSELEARRILARLVSYEL